MEQEFDRSEIIFICSMFSNYTESYLEKLNDEDLLEFYDTLMKK